MMARTILIILLLTALGLLSPGPGHGELHFGPYLQSLRADTILVCAWVDERDEVEVRLSAPGSEPRSIAAEGATPACALVSQALGVG